MSKRVAVLKGGWSSEREVSLTSGTECANALRKAGYAVTEIDLRRDLGALLAALTPAPEVVFNALHGRYGEDGHIQAILNILGIPYTHSGLLASAIAMDKARSTWMITCRRACRACGLLATARTFATDSWASECTTHLRRSRTSKDGTPGTASRARGPRSPARQARS